VAVWRSESNWLSSTKKSRLAQSKRALLKTSKSSKTSRPRRTSIAEQADIHEEVLNAILRRLEAGTSVDP